MRLDGLRQATRVRVSRPHVGAVIGQIECICTIAELPGLLAAGDEDVYEILRELKVSRVAKISYAAGDGDTVIFSAFECDGVWVDLHNRLLKIEIVGQHEWPQSAKPKPRYLT